jgi:hypothetical protein
LSISKKNRNNATTYFVGFSTHESNGILYKQENSLRLISQLRVHADEDVLKMKRAIEI